MEAIVGMVIILTSFSITLVVFLNVVSSSNSKANLDAQIQLRETAMEVKSNRQYIDGDDKAEGLTIEKTFEEYEGNPQLMIFELKAVNAKKKVVGVRRELILSYQ